MDVNNIRRLNLTKYIDSHYGGNRAAFCRASGKNPNLINLVLSENKEYRRNIGEKLARGLEVLCGLPAGWLDAADGSGMLRPSLIPISVLPWTIPDEVPVGSEFGVALPMEDSRLMQRATDTKNLIIVVSQESSMSPTIQIGDYVWIDLGIKKYVTDGIYVIRKDDTTAFTRIQRMSDTDYRLSIDDRAFEPVIVKGKGFASQKVVGRVIATWRPIQL
jgi:hypothetical protein